MPESTILFPNYNNEHVLPLTFEYLRKHVDCSSVNLVVVDDGSEDNGIRVLKEEISRSNFANAELIEARHEGIIAALNAGLHACKTPYVFRIDGDATVETPGWLERMRGLMRQYPQLGMIGAQVIFDSGQVHSFGRAAVGELGLYDIGTLPAESVGKRTFDSITHRPKTHFINGKPYAVDTALGVCVGFRTEEALAVGGFDAMYSPVWIEDDDFGLMLRKAGKHVIVDPTICVTHRTSLRGNRQPGKTGSAKTEPQTVRRRTLSRLVPNRLKVAAKVLLGMEDTRQVSICPTPKESDPWRIGILQKHYRYWESKWGFNPLNPDLGAIYNRYWDSLLCWKLNPELYRTTRKLEADLALIS